MDQPFTFQLARPSFSSTGGFSGSRRKKIWELAHNSHCPVIGVCFSLESLRKIINQCLGGQTLADDYELHVGAVAECRSRTRVAEQIQRDLDRRFAGVVQKFKAAKSLESLKELWQTAKTGSTITGAFWAVITHPRCDGDMEDQLTREIHMMQHELVAGVRIDAGKYQHLRQENLTLIKELAKVQNRTSRLIAEKSAEIEKLQSRLIQAQGALVYKDSQLTFLRNDMDALKAGISDFDSRLRLKQKNEALAERVIELETRIRESRRHPASVATESGQLGTAQSVESPVNETTFPLQPLHDIRTDLRDKTIVCVGGRSGSIASYRAFIEQIGGQFSHHDGGIEDNPRQLEHTLSSADLVVCQTGCVSHNAYWRVKDYCKRTGKQCVFVENPSISSLARSLSRLETKETQ